MTTTHTISPEHAEELQALIGRWATEKNIITGGDVLEVAIKVIRRPLVQLKVTTETENPTEHDAMLVTDLELSVRATHFLGNAGIKTVGELRSKTLKDMCCYRNLGNKTRRELQDKLATLGITVDWAKRKTN
ncbi:MAG TPA: DNA-directed RNA polymerase subunit alpha C-terminal domain-containing protein [Candidatus Paceibacterota bacterium]|jgi:DNA-directed RNA polymerase, alpha subunit/40 kD subunit